MRLIQRLVVTLFVILLHNISFASDATQHSESIDDSTKSAADFQNIIDEFKAYAATVPQDVQKEVVDYRIKISDLNKQKRQLYKKLSQDAQDYLQQLQAYKAKLPLQHKAKIKPTLDSDTSSDTDTKPEDTTNNTP